MSSQKRIFMTGASGYIGRVITEFAIAKGYSVHGLSRTTTGDEILSNLGATPVRGDLSTLDVLRNESAQADIVLHLAFIHDFRMNYEEVLRIDAAAVDALAEPLKGTGKPLVISSGSALVKADPQGGETDENSPLPEKPLIDRIRAEQHALSWNQKGVRVIAIRLAPYVYGRAGHGFVAMLIQTAFKLGESTYIDSGAIRTSCVYVDDAARLYLLVAEQAEAGEVFNCTGSTSVTSKEIAEAIGDLLGVPVKSVSKEEAETKRGRMLTLVTMHENRASSRKAIERLGWELKGIDLLSEIKTGSYREVAAKLKQEGA